MTALPKSEQLAELGFAREDHLTSMSVGTYPDGTVVTLLQLGSGTMMYYPATLGQAIQLRDFLNRHIDELALKQTGSLAQRASDDPTQLASIEEIPHYVDGVQTGTVRVEVSRGCGRRFQYTDTYRLSCGEQSPFGPHAALCPDCTSRE